MVTLLKLNIDCEAVACVAHNILDASAAAGFALSFPGKDKKYQWCNELYSVYKVELVVKRSNWQL